MKNINKFKISALASAIFTIASAQAFEIENQGVTFGFNGYVNTHVVYVSCDDNPDNVAGTLYCARVTTQHRSQMVIAQQVFNLAQPRKEMALI